jgi:hypothetical protein
MSSVRDLPPNESAWWKNAKIERIEVKPIPLCHHEFRLTKEGAECMKCNLGFLGEGFEIRDGKLCNNKKPAH